eukprot:10625532-Alexandrium_andersonii.AAC.1
MSASLVGSEMCIRDSLCTGARGARRCGALACSLAVDVLRHCPSVRAQSDSARSRPSLLGAA